MTLPHSPMDALKQKKVHKDVPIIIGTAIEDSFVDIGADAKMEDFEPLGRLKCASDDTKVLQ